VNGSDLTATTSTSHTADLVAIAADTETVSTVAKGGTVYVCTIVRDANNSLLATTYTAYASQGANQTGGSSSATFGIAATGIALTLPAGSTGAGTVTAVVTDVYGNVITLSTPLTVYGSVASLTLANVGYAAQYGSGTGTLALTYKDSAGVAFGPGTDANLAFTVDSDANSTAAADRSSDSAGAAVTSDVTAATFVADGYNTATVSCANSTKAEKLMITAWTKDSAGAYTIKSATVPFYCSDATTATGSKLTVTPTATTLDPAGTTTVNVSLVDPSGYPMPDGTSVTLVANNGGGIAAPSTTTTNGAFKYAATFIAGSSGDSTIVATGPKGIVGTATVAISGGASDAASLATDAANAATDAANAAAASADNATQAASDALAAVQALDEKVTSLISALQKQIAALAKAVAAKKK